LGDFNFIVIQIVVDNFQRPTSVVFGQATNLDANGDAIAGHDSASGDS